MSRPETRAPIDRAPGLLDPPEATRLRPWALLQRLRPIQLATLARQLHTYERLNLGLQLLDHHFPTTLPEYTDLSSTGWWEVLADLVNRVEQAGWFQVNWPALNRAWAYWMEDPEEGGDHLAAFLHYMPVTLYGFSDGETIFDEPVIELLHTLLADCDVQTVSAQLLIDCEIYDDLDDIWRDADRQAAWTLLSQIEADPGRYPEPARWLPELARWACHRTGNVMLDRSFDPHHDGPWFTWADDLAEIKHAWRRAQPLLKALQRVTAWCEQDNTHIAKLAHFIMEGGSTDELTW
jgi:hypothetical protein